ncbi:MAG: YfhO family protein [Flavobacteriia bacterium]|nr:YfhO family protein [Flavobacteriia bacterium]
MKNFFIKNWMHFAVIALFFIVTFVYFSPEFQGYGLKQHDIEQHVGMAHETMMYREKFNKEPLWTNSMFGGMPTTQISMLYDGNIFQNIITCVYLLLGVPTGIFFMHLIGFYLFSRFLKLKPLVGVIGAFAFAFSSYEIIVLQAGHNSKAMTVALIAPVIGAFIYAYKTNWKWGAILSAFFMALELASNHLQVTYYFGILLLFLGIYFLIEAIKNKKIKNFMYSSGAVMVAYLIALLANYGNISLTNEYAKETIRGGNDVTITPEGKAKIKSEGLDKDYITNWSYGKGESFTLLSPYVKGSATVGLGQSNFVELIENSDLDPEDIKNSLEAPYAVYWGDQPMTSGPVYLGVVVVFLALLGMVIIKDRSKWIYLGASILALLLSWGKNYMGLTDFFIDYIPGYNKFRTVTIILVVVELCIPIIMVLLLNKIILNREEIKVHKKPFLVTSGVFLLFLIIVKFAGLNDGFATQAEKDRLASIRPEIEKQILSTDPEQLKQYGIDINNVEQVNQVIEGQIETTNKQFDSMREARNLIFSSSMNRSILFTILTIGLLLLIYYTSISSLYIVAGLGILILMDLIPVDRNYLNSDTDDRGEYKFWTAKENKLFPISTNAGDLAILENEIRNPSIAKLVAKGEAEGKQKADELGYSGSYRARVIDAYKFSALNFATDYRVMDYDGFWSSTRASYFHKSLGGYHGAKLNNIQNLFNFHLSKTNNKVIDMLNVKYIIQGEKMNLNPTALGNAWFVKKIKSVPTVNAEILALGKILEIKNIGKGTFFVNGKIVSEAKVHGSEKIQYLIDGKDTMSIPLSNGLTKGMQALFVMDANGSTNLIPKSTQLVDTASSFQSFVSIELLSDFDPQNEAIMVKEEASKIASKSFTAEGLIKLNSYLPNKLVYTAECKGNQMAVFSEIYYRNGWKAFVDGKETEIRKVDYLLRGLELKSGKHKIEFVFDLPKYHKANLYSIIASLILLISTLFVLLNMKKTIKAKS